MAISMARAYALVYFEGYSPGALGFTLFHCSCCEDVLATVVSSVCQTLSCHLRLGDCSQGKCLRVGVKGVKGGSCTHLLALSAAPGTSIPAPPVCGSAHGRRPGVGMRDDSGRVEGSYCEFEFGFCDKTT